MLMYNCDSVSVLPKSLRNEIRIILVGNEAKVFFDRYKDVTSQLESQKYRTIFSLLLKRMGQFFLSKSFHYL